MGLIDLLPSAAYCVSIGALLCAATWLKLMIVGRELDRLERKR